ncbi:NTPase [Pontibacillus halophilus JSM 076056 = DSM 19796]|uniref:inosine/xanthosine triphosphatase n=1 Tax=Pontibacillus halophilus JSM 076056 = DSM 19796 TaxID=1385510 RepID=A0A0A5GDY5_9BACI|nr:DUF84 family protein [Pontibacillus halophilus]KGX89413.1 NTPase [Pontibacillus halophilus JSM 076056 = DSM 19796]
MKIIVGSKNPTKVHAVQQVFHDCDIEGMEVSSKVSSQPFSDEETREGAINRARECASQEKGAIGVGLEGGVMEFEGDLYLCNWGALVCDKENVYTASGARIPLPDEVASELNKGKELGDVMDAYTKKKGVRNNEGAIGVFTNGLVNRDELFAHVVKLLKGQYDMFQCNEGQRIEGS